MLATKLIMAFLRRNLNGKPYRPSNANFRQLTGLWLFQGTIEAQDYDGKLNSAVHQIPSNLILQSTFFCSSYGNPVHIRS